MGKFMKPGKVVLVLSGRFAGRKAVIVKVGVFFVNDFFSIQEWNGQDLIQCLFKKKNPIASYLFSDVDVEFYMIDGLMVHIN